jgi:hypothetical protein
MFPSSHSSPKDSGSIYSFARNAGIWVPQGKIKPADGQAGDQFGVSVSLRGTTVLVGAPLDDDQGTDAGSAYVFNFINGTWVQETKLYASDPLASDLFGYSVSLAPSMAIIGAYNHDTMAGANAGTVYVFKHNMVTWVQDSFAQAVDAQANDILGFNVALDPSKTRFVAGAWGDDDLGSNAGAAYVFSFGKPMGATCATDAECASTFCADGVCCESACGGGSETDCQVCSIAKGSPANGYCSSAPPTTICRAAVSACDIAEKCDGMATTCPMNDVWAPPGTLCRAVAGACDVAETCTGMSNQCPPDAIVSTCAATTARSPSMATRTPKSSDACPSDAKSFCSCDQVVPFRTNTYADPLWEAFTSSQYAPVMTVFPEIATDSPSLSDCDASLAMSFACWLHVLVATLRTKTYTHPASRAAASSK